MRQLLRVFIVISCFAFFFEETVEYGTTEDLEFFQSNSWETIKNTLLLGNLVTWLFFFKSLECARLLKQNGFYTYTEAKRLLENYQTYLPFIAHSVKNIGKSYDSNPTYAIQLALDSSFSIDYIDSVTSGDLSEINARPGLLLTGFWRGSDIISLEMAFYYIKKLIKAVVDNEKDIIYILKSRQVWIVPVVNPDTLLQIESEYKSTNQLVTYKKNRNTSSMFAQCTE